MTWGLLILLSGSPGVWAHGGEDHDHDEARAPTPNLAVPARAAAHSEDFELVVVLDDDPHEGRHVHLILDQFATNVPVPGAHLEIDGAGMQVVAREVSPGVYEAQWAGLTQARPGTRLPLTVAVEAGGQADLLAVMLDIPATPDNPATPPDGRLARLGWLAGGVLALMTAGLGFASRRKNRPNNLH